MAPRGERLDKREDDMDWFIMLSNDGEDWVAWRQGFGRSCAVSLRAGRRLRDWLSGFFFLGDLGAGLGVGEDTREVVGGGMLNNEGMANCCCGGWVLVGLAVAVVVDLPIFHAFASHSNKLELDGTLAKREGGLGVALGFNASSRESSFLPAGAIIGMNRLSSSSSSSCAGATLCALSLGREALE